MIFLRDSASQHVYLNIASMELEPSETYYSGGTK